MTQMYALFTENFFVATKVALPFLLALLLSGLAIGLVQAATQVNEAATPFIVKLFAVAIVCLALGDWGLNALAQTFSNNMKQISIYKNLNPSDIKKEESKKDTKITPIKP